VVVSTLLVAAGLATNGPASGLGSPLLSGPSTAPSGFSSASPSASPSPVVVVTAGAGTFANSDGESGVAGSAGQIMRYHVQVEDGVGVDANGFAAEVDAILGDPRSWTADGSLRLQRVDPSKPADFTIYLASPTTSEQMCRAEGLETEQFTNCRLHGRVVINSARWLTGVPDYGASLSVYRAYAINHEVGHELGQWHELCPGPGQPAPVMQQQTLGLQGCVANAWPFVNGARYRGPAAGD
jgi:Protein of unknown function (DUF3152)